MIYSVRFAARFAPLFTGRRSGTRFVSNAALLFWLGLLSVSSATAGAADWPQFLGPRRNGISAETGLLDRWPEQGLKIVWRTEGGVGMSGIAVRDGQLATMAQSDEKQFVIALDAKSGKRQWQTEIAPRYRNQMGNGPRATPTITDRRVFVFSGEGILACLDRKDGKLLWKHDVVKELNGRPADYGMACSPLVTGELVVVTSGAPRAAVVAYARATGKLVWKAGDDAAGYSSPNVLNVGGRNQLVVFTGGSALGLAPDTGATLWRYPYVTDYGCNIATPIAYKGNVFLSAAESHGCVLLALKASGDKFETSEVWKSQGGRSVLRNEWQTSILLDGHLYGLDNVGSAGPTTHLTCVEAATGRRVWQQPRFGKSNLIAADGKLFFSTMKGELVVVRATSEKYDEVGRQTVLETTRQAPALANGLLYLRDNREIVCVDVRGE